MEVSSALTLVSVSMGREFPGPFVFGAGLRPVVVAGDVAGSLVKDFSGGQRLVAISLEMRRQGNRPV